MIKITTCMYICMYDILQERPKRQKILKEKLSFQKATKKKNVVTIFILSLSYLDRFL